MNRAYGVLALVSGLAVAATMYAHVAQLQNRDRMHQGVIRDLEREKLEASLAPAVAVATAGGASDPNCVGDVCNLATTRFRDPKTGLVVSEGGPLR